MLVPAVGFGPSILSVSTVRSTIIVAVSDNSITVVDFAFGCLTSLQLYLHMIICTLIHNMYTGACTCVES